MNEDEAVAAEVGAVVAGRYRLEHVLERGAMSLKWRARDEALGRPVAVKEVHFPADVSEEGMCEHIISETRKLVQLDHHGVVPVYDVRAERGRCFIVMQLIDGRSLAEEIDFFGPLPPVQVAAIGLQLLDVLAAAHRVGLVHRSLDPSNVLLAADDRVLLTDFGITVDHEARKLTSTYQMAVAPVYWSPEQLQGEAGGPPADIWSLGATLYAALETQPPFAARTAAGTVAAVLNDDVVPPLVSGPLREALLGMMRKAPGARLQPATIHSLLHETAHVRAETPALSTHASALVPASVMAPAFTWAAAEERGTRSPWLSRALLIAASVLVVLVAVVIVAYPFGAGTPSADPEPPGSPSGTGVTELSVPSPFESQALFEFNRDLVQPSDCRTAAAGEFPVLEKLPDLETLFCEASGREVRLFRKESADELPAERQLYINGAIDGSVRRLPRAPSGPPGLFDGRHFTFSHASDLKARVYWDSVSCSCGGVIVGRDDDVRATVNFWLDR